MKYGFDHDALATALGEVGGDADRFKAGVHAEIARREAAETERSEADAEASVEVHSPDPTADDAPAPPSILDDEPAPPSTLDDAETPPWLRRAAGMLPPGALEMGAYKGAPGTSILTGLATPWILLFAAVAGWLGMLRATARLDASNSKSPEMRALHPLGKLYAFPAGCVAKCVFPFLLGGLVMVLLVTGNGHLASLWFVGVALCLTASLVLLGRVGMASRDQVAVLALDALEQQGFMMILLLSSLGNIGPLSLYGTPIVLMVGMLLVGRLSRHRSVWFQSLWTLPLMLFPALSVFLIGRGEGGVTSQGALTWSVDRDDRGWAEWGAGLELDPEDLGGWTCFGNLGRILSLPVRAGLDLSPARESLEAAFVRGADPHPRVILAAWRLGILEGDRLQQQVRPDQLLENAFRSSRTFHVSPHEAGLLEVLALVEGETLDAARRQRILEGVEEALPGATDLGAVEKADKVVLMADALGDATFVERHRDRLRAILTAAWHEDVRGQAGFGSWAPGNPRYRPSVLGKPTFAALMLMGRVGVPDAVDLLALGASLEEAVRVHGGRVAREDHLLAGQSLLVLRRDFAVPPTSLSPYPASRARTWPERELVFLSALALVLLALWSVGRARIVPTLEEGPLFDPDLAPERPGRRTA